MFDALLAFFQQPQSTVTFEGKLLTGPQQIIEKYMVCQNIIFGVGIFISCAHFVAQSLGGVQHNIPQLVKDVQIGASSNALLIFVSGQLRLGGEQTLQFAQMFQLVATGPGAYYVHNEIFRLIYA